MLGQPGHIVQELVVLVWNEMYNKVSQATKCKLLAMNHVFLCPCKFAVVGSSNLHSCAHSHKTIMMY